jgi:hypothetical protein
MANGAPAPTPAADWAPTELVELPSGKHARLRQKLALRALVRRGDLDIGEVALVAAGELADAQRALVIEAALLTEMFVEPKLVTGKQKPGKQQIHVDDLDDDDATFVLQLALGGAPDLATFRDDDGGGDPGDDGAGVEQEPERDAGAGGGEPGSVDAGPSASAPPKRAARGRRK